MTRRAAIVALCALVLVTSLGGLVIMVLPRSAPAPDPYGFRGSILPFIAVFALIGAAMAWRQPRNAVGWICLGSAAAGRVVAAARDTVQPAHASVWLRR